MEKEFIQKKSTLYNKAISLPIVTSGITHGISVLSDMWVDKGDARGRR
ncbi:MAG: hypothetical protein KKH85_09945 [Proteobacteria bacterium]|nr:hypothetical protein [Pseudomonadota bacterium]